VWREYNQLRSGRPQEAPHWCDTRRNILDDKLFKIYATHSIAKALREMKERNKFFEIIFISLFIFYGFVIVVIEERDFGSWNHTSNANTDSR